MIRDRFFDVIGYSLLILTPFVVGFFVAVGAAQSLGAVFPFNLIIAVVMELSGILSMHLISRLADWNTTHEEQAPIGWAITGAMSYLIIALGIIVLLDWPPGRRTVVKGSFVLLGLVVYMLFTMYHQQMRRERGEEVSWEAGRSDERWKYEADHEYKLERLRIKTSTVQRVAQKESTKSAQKAQIPKPTVQRGTYSDFCAMQAAQNGNGDMPVSAIREQFNVSKRTAYYWLSNYKLETEKELANE